MTNSKKTRIIKGRVTEQQSKKLDAILKHTSKNVSEWIRDKIDRAREL